MSELYGMAGHLIRRLHQISVALFSERLERAGVELTPVQFAALVSIDAHPGIDQATLAGLVAHDRATLGGVVDRLERKGLVRREISAHDRRARALHLSGAGRTLLRRARPLVEALQEDILAGLDAREQRELLRMLRKTVDAGNAASRAPLRVPRA